MPYFYSPKRKVIIFVAPKCGTESVRYLILCEENIKIKNHNDIWHKINKSMIKIPNPRMNIKQLVIVRNPFMRLVSGYITKFLTLNYKKLDFSKKVARYYKTNNNRRVTFEELVNYIIKQNPRNLDLHFKPQMCDFKFTKNYEIIKLEEVHKINDFLKKNNFKNRFENYNRKFLFTNKKKNIENAFKMKYFEFDIGEKRDEISEEGIAYNDAIIPFYHNFYNDELIEKVYKYYEQDFNRLNYEKKFLVNNNLIISKKCN
jgi:hypothetical protein